MSSITSASTLAVKVSTYEASSLPQHDHLKTYCLSVTVLRNLCRPICSGLDLDSLVGDGQDTLDSRWSVVIKLIFSENGVRG
jgi:hypothetical protein